MRIPEPQTFLFLVLALCHAGSEDVRICDSPSPSLPAPAIYSNYIKELYDLELSSSKIQRTIPSYCENVESMDSELSSYQQTKRECERIAKIIADYEKGVGLTVNWPVQYLVKTVESGTAPRYSSQILRLKYDSNENEPLHNYVARTARSTAWTSVTFDKPDGYKIQDRCYYSENPPRASYNLDIPCIHPLYRLSQEIFKPGSSFSFSKTGLLGPNSANMDAYIRIDKKLYTGNKKKIVQVMANGISQWGVLTAGCSPPEFIIKMIWEVDAANKCHKPVITITDIEDGEDHECKMGFSSNSLRTKISPLLDPTQQREQAKNLLKTYHYTYNTKLMKVILLSEDHKQSISRCLFPDQSQMYSSYKWDEWSPAAPGKCVACSSLTKLATQIPRPCNRSLPLEQSLDCCFDCAKGYNSLVRRSSSQKQCVKVCRNGFAYNDEGADSPQCVKCVAGKYTQKGRSGCFSCADLGVPNGIVNEKKGGCVSCGNRAWASGTSCRPCLAFHYVPQNANSCERCPEGSRLISAESTECTNCSAGFKIDNYYNCILCPLHTFKAVMGKGECTQCPYGTTSVANRSVCVPCNTLNKTLTPYAIYADVGCDVICNKSVSYARTSNPYASDGCAPCTDRPPPVGTYPLSKNCVQFSSCTNKPAIDLAEYTSGGSTGNPTSCQWGCKTGYRKEEATAQCTACVDPSFNASKHVYIDHACNFACLPGVFYRGSNNNNKECTQKCTNLKTLTSAGDDTQGGVSAMILYPRVSNYFTFSIASSSMTTLITSRPRYIMGKCGSDERDSSSELSLLRNVGIYGVYTATSAGASQLCGNYMLDTDEECDDGNQKNNDGCSDSCKVEREGYWDCDVIGEPCKPNCGWDEAQSQSNALGAGLTGYKFNPVPAQTKGLPLCTGVTYRDFRMVAVERQAQWMRDMLIVCDCPDNPMQTLPYSECNHTNQGCRMCEEGQYKDDLYGSCSQCGSACAVGFRPYNASEKGENLNKAKLRFGFSTSESLQKCNPNVATSKVLTYADPVDDPLNFGRDQIMIGCVPCQLDSMNELEDVVFVQGSDGGTCNWACKRDPANQTDPDFYCRDSNKTVCNGLCINCDTSLQSVLRTLSSEGVGQYVMPCMDRVGHSTGRCNSLDAVRNARYIGNSVTVVGDSGGCPWICNSGYQRFEDTCKPCMSAADLSCGQNEIALACSPLADPSPMKKYCAPCSFAKKGVALLQPFEEWQSVPPLYADCIPTCQKGVAFRGDNSADKCQQCTQPLCEINELFVPCTPTNDSSCVPCGQTESYLQASNQEYYQEGTCMLRCGAGYALSSEGECVACSSLLGCNLGEHRAHTCQEPYQRNALPECVKCDIDGPLNLPTQGRQWIGFTECVTTCAPGWMLHGDANRTCVRCPSERCVVGFKAVCQDGNLQCLHCDTYDEISKIANAKFAGPGNCTIICISSAYRFDPMKGVCNPILSSDTSGMAGNPTSIGEGERTVEYGVDLLSMAENKTAGVSSPYPLRNIPHSAYTPAA